MTFFHEKLDQVSVHITAKLSWTPDMEPPHLVYTIVLY